MTTNITVLAEDSVKNDSIKFRPEHGLSLLIQIDNKKILFDTGCGNTFIHNAKVLSIDLNTVDMVIISHHHYDHAGGLSHFLKINSKAKIYMHPISTKISYYKKFAFYKKDIGINFKLLLQEHSNRFEFVDNDVELFENIYMLKIIGRNNLPTGNKFIFVKQNNKYFHDTFEHEHICVLQDNDGLVVITGCAHSGIINIINTVNNFSPKPIKAIIGGFHLASFPLINYPLDRKIKLNRICEKLANCSCKKIYTGHCTSDSAYNYIKSKIPSGLKHLYTGLNFNI